MGIRFKILLCFIAVAAVFVCVTGPLALMFLKEPPELPKIPFDEVVWKKAKYNYETHTESDIRGQMTDDLFKRYNFKGWTSDQIIALLGESDSHGELKGEWNLIYGLGRLPSKLQIDYRNLGFKLDSEGRVASYGFFLH